ncbi:MAG: DMT family transporter [Planctomycetota bacterium]|nr:MAG: DMT family transporter [Planctomycetota bacterium]
MNAARHDRDWWLGVAALVLCALLWSLNGPLIKLLHARGGVSGEAIAAYRSLVGGVVFLLPAWRRRATLRQVARGWPIGSLVCFTLMTACFVKATTMTAAANAIVLQYTSPIWVFALSPLLLGVRPRWADGVWLAPAMAGVAVILAWQWSTDLLGLIVALGSGLGYGALTITLRGLRNVDPTVVVAINFLGSGLLLLPWGLASGMAVAADQIWLVLSLGIVQFSLPYVIFSWALRRVDAHHAALIVLLEAVLNPVLTWLVVGEAVPAATLAGGPLIMLGVVGWMIATWRSQERSRAEASADAPPPPPA